MTSAYRQRIEHAIGRHPPLLGVTARRAVFSVFLSIPTALGAFAIADKAPVPEWVRLLVSPGVLVGFRFVHSQPCGGLLDCLGQVMGAYARGAEIACAVNAVLYSILIFGVATAISPLSRKAD